MKQATFINENKNDSREILIIIEHDYISFYFANNYYKHKEWAENEVERRIECGEIELEKNELEPSEFYGFEINRWKNKAENFPEHISGKNWFSLEMLKFINENV